MACNDGSPEDVLRFQRDVLGCRVLTLTDHVEYMSGVEFRYVMDQLEAEASEDVVVLYGVEWAKHPAHDTNFLTCERDVLDRLRAILLAESHLQDVFVRIKAELPSESVVAIRHFHGRLGEPHGIDGAQTAATYDGYLERAMEVVQTRGDMMVQPPEPCPLFPASFIRAGADIGLVGGSDHSRGGPQKFCLTGFWVEELTPTAVFSALRRGRTMACASGKLAMWAFRVDDSVKVHVASPTPLMSASLWYDGKWVEQGALSGSAAMRTFPLRGPGTVVRAEAHSAHAGWPTVVGYTRPWID
jgi:hypothetical protein